MPQTPTEALVVRSADVGLVDLLNMSFDTMSAPHLALPDGEQPA